MIINIVIQARLNSKRLPGKVLFKINNTTVLEHVYKKIIKIKNNYKNIKNIIIATSDNKLDNKIYNFCKNKCFPVFRGKLNNVYHRLTSAAELYNTDYLIRISADSPLIDISLIEYALNNINISNYDLITNVFPRSYPKGQSFEIISLNLLKENYKNILTSSDKEHVTKYFYRNCSKFKIFNVKNKHENLSSYNFAVDTKKDLQRVMYIMKKMKNSDTKNLIKLYKQFGN